MKQQCKYIAISGNNLCIRFGRKFKQNFINIMLIDKISAQLVTVLSGFSQKLHLTTRKWREEKKVQSLF